jgi:murein L,D-transpeptidase YafK
MALARCLRLRYVSDSIDAVVLNRYSFVLVLFALMFGARIAASETTADLVVVEKSKHMLQLLEKGRVIKTYRVALGRNPVGPKKQRGDSKTPEGEYVIDGRNLQSQFHKALHISLSERPGPVSGQKGGS